MVLNLYKIAVLSIFIGNVYPQSPCEDWEAYEDETCIKIFKLPGLLGYSDASSYCSSQSANLMTIDTQQKQNFIEKFLKSTNTVDNVWLGLKYSQTNGYEWSDGTPFRYDNWEAGSPKNDSNYCVEIHSEEEEYGKWSEVLCDRKNLIVCEKLQLWSSSKVQKSLMNLMKKFDETPPVPKGFIYVQLPSEDGPQEIWPWLKWKDITSQYAGVFFRAEGGNSSPFGQIQEENSPRLVNVKYDYNPDHDNHEKYLRNLDLHANNQQTEVIRTGVWDTGSWNAETGLSFRISGEEVRPRNMAIRIWKRID